jgi:hypothetical protein
MRVAVVGSEKLLAEAVGEFGNLEETELSLFKAATKQQLMNTQARVRFPALPGKK